MDQRSETLAIASRAFAVAVLLGSGFVLALSWAARFPAAVLATAWLVALIAMAFIVGLSRRDSRREGIGFFRSVGRTFKDLGRFILWFF